MAEGPHRHRFLLLSVEWNHLQQQIQSAHSRLDSSRCSEDKK